MTDRTTIDARPIVGWFVVGPMESICVDHGTTDADAARDWYTSKRRWVADVWPIHEGETATLDEVRCAVCDKLIVP